MSFPVPHDRFKGKVKPEWIDQNGHMNRFRCKDSILAVGRAGRMKWFCCKDSELAASRLREDETAAQAAAWNSPAMNSARALMSPPSMFRTCPFLIIAIAS